MNKLLAAATAVFFALTAMLGSGAEAGFSVRLAAPAGFSSVQKAGCGGGGYYRSYSYSRRVYRSASRPAKRRIAVAEKPAVRTVDVAKAEPETKSAAETNASSDVAQTENSSISAADEVAKVEPAKSEPAKSGPVKPETKVVATKDVGCKKFFPSVGMTLSVSCE